MLTVGPNRLSQSTFLGRSVASGILRELFKITEVSGRCQPQFHSSLARSAFTASADPPMPLGSWPPPHFTALKCQNIHTPTAARSTWLLIKHFPAATWVWSPVGPLGSRPGSKRLDCASSNPQPADPAVSSRSTRSCRGAKLSLTCPTLPNFSMPIKPAGPLLHCPSAHCNFVRVTRLRRGHKAGSAEILCKTEAVSLLACSLLMSHRSPEIQFLLPRHTRSEYP
jgi:hypothetical protein